VSPYRNVYYPGRWSGSLCILYHRSAYGCSKTNRGVSGGRLNIIVPGAQSNCARISTLRPTNRTIFPFSASHSVFCLPLVEANGLQRGTVQHLLHCALASCGAVYCNRSCLWVCDSQRAQCLRLSERFLPAGCHGNLPVLNLLSASVAKNQHFRPCRKTMRWIEK